MGRKRKRTSKKGRRVVRRRTRSRARRRLFRKTTRLLRGPVNKRALVKLLYVDTVITSVPVPDALQYHIFRANSLYDPDYTGTGHQPRGFDELSAAYHHYTVLGAKIHVKCTNNSSNPQVFGIALRASTTTQLDPQQIKEEQRRKYKIIQPKPTGETSVSAMSMRFSTKRYFSCKSVIGDGSYKGNTGNTGIGSNPTEQAFFQIFYGNAVQGNTTAAAAFHVSIQYIAMFTEPKTIGQS